MSQEIFQEYIQQAKKLAKEHGFDSIDEAHRYYFPEKYTNKVSNQG